MFSNFIYFILALIALSLYQPTQSSMLSPSEAFVGFVCFSLLFAVYTRSRFFHLARLVGKLNSHRLDQRFSAMVTHHSLLALLTFAADIWILDLPSYLSPLKLFTLLPTLSNLLFLAVFIGYLTIVWVFAFDAHTPIYGSDISRGSYVYSNLAFSVPVLLPWVLLFFISDLLYLLPFEWPKRFLNTDIGHTVYFLIFLLVTAIFTPLLVQRVWRCTPLPPGTLRERIVSLCQRAGVAYADIVYWPIFGGQMITAGVMGLVARFRYILVTDALLRLLSPDELDQVIAHEIGHVKRKHLLLYLMFIVGFMLITYAVFPLSNLMLLHFFSLQRFIVTFHIDSNKFIFALSAVLLVAAIVVYFRYIFGYFIRNFERQADLFVFRLFPSVQPLIATFDKIVTNSGQPADKPNWHHFSIQQRIDYLRRCETDPAWIQRHERKVKRSIAIYLCSLVILGLGVFHLNQLNSPESVRRLNINAIEHYLSNKAHKTKDDVFLYRLLANNYMAQKDDSRAVKTYQRALQITPNDPDLLNNLAWLFATTEEGTLRDPLAALVMAQRAIQLKSAPHIWDTLAEAFYVNGRFQKAVAAEKRALSMNPADRQPYERQLAKFQKALENQRTFQRKE
ncbi:MAG: M48 family metalloprotease [Desulfatitalea sp.]|nr:M48 family metalloprotease [Desulfatitalea sp.]NNK02425.1 M48 family metalloprotease [Desulfatitalea sp.]